ncbi:hypothetical protein NCLIV_035000 [Neospora caninum Liverpool]|uniref:Probable protein phosphatase 2C 48 n=1 Tax=Neospora caninum (strain Liverpool) TaxID=572307 RepID=F0VJ07_NEOCL|nr:hypothetical protein NCLIV_035000 [Neospora caninum Liverpool]CBZ53718.1 hypothetical protein NCLIV_035000 [Neospora caninum Liverpool]CEL67709.1 TPA: Probable protein phosphatase 2C 48 [Neospora caninum Liverpool]|eukprot:XP_003883750.1 hypothetical protein NCLIV_035000 [Neospora caninum Liverpool]
MSWPFSKLISLFHLPYQTRTDEDQGVSMGTCASKLGAVSAASTARQAASRGAGEGDQVRLRPQATIPSHSKSLPSKRSDVSLSAAHRSVLGKFLHPPGYQPASRSPAPPQQYPHHYDTSPVSSANRHETDDLPGSGDTHDGESLLASAKQSELGAANRSPTGQGSNIAVVAGSSTNPGYADALESPSLAILTETCSNEKMAEPQSDNPGAGSAAGNTQDRNDKRSGSPLDGRSFATERCSGEDKTGERAEGTSAAREENAKRDSDRPRAAETWPGSPQRRRRLSLSRSAGAREDADEKARGQAIIAVGAEVPAGVLLAQRLGNTKPPGGKALDRASSSPRVSAKKECEESEEGEQTRNSPEPHDCDAPAEVDRGDPDKKVEKHGQAAQQDSLNQFGIGMCCKKGFKPESPNQDDFFIIKVDKWSLYGVFDGHGPLGHDVSNYVQRELPARLLYGEPPFLSYPLRALHTSFTTVHHELEDQTDDALSGAAGIDCSMSGTTATVILHIHALKKLFVAHVGDSRAVIGRREPGTSGGVAGVDRFRPQTRNESARPEQSTPDPRQSAQDRGIGSAATECEGQSPSRLTAVDLTNDHKPTNEVERQRIQKAGGQVRRLDGDVPHRVFLKNRLFPGLAMSRAIGDTIATQAGVIADPEVREYEILEGRDEFLLICSDGVWEFISSQEAVNMVGAFGRDQVQKACDAIAREAWRRWIEEEHNVVDDITVIVIYF